MQHLLRLKVVLSSEEYDPFPDYFVSSKDLVNPHNFIKKILMQLTLIYLCHGGINNNYSNSLHVYTV